MAAPSKRRASIGFNILGISGEITEESIVDFAEDVDERIKKLSQVRDDLQAAVIAVDSLRGEATQRHQEVKELRDAVAQLHQDRQTTQSLLELPQESFARVLSEASAKKQLRGRIEGTIIGLLTGCISSYLVWYMTK